MGSEQMQPATGGSKEHVVFFSVQMIAGAMYCPYLSKKQQKGCFDTQKQPASKNAGGKKSNTSKGLPCLLLRRGCLCIVLKKVDTFLIDNPTASLQFI